MAANPFGEFKDQCRTCLLEVIAALYPEKASMAIGLETPPSPKLGDLASSISFELSREVGVKPSELAENIAGNMKYDRFGLIEKVQVAGGYINFHLNYQALTEITLDSVRKFGSEYGYVKTDKPEKIIVEHTSVNPIHAIHVGQARNPVLGDAIARILKARGHRVSAHYYVDDTGRQIAVIAYGYKKLGEPKPIKKPDHFIGEIYAAASCIFEIQKLKKQSQVLKGSEEEEQIKKLKRDLDEWVSVADELQTKYAEVFEKLLKEIQAEPEAAEKEADRIMREYEGGSAEARRLVREVCNLCIDGFKQTLERMNIKFDSWDWESELLWSGKVSEVLENLSKTPFVSSAEGPLKLNVMDAVEQLKLRPLLGISGNFDLSPLTLGRTDGTTLYTTRDIAYSMRKFDEADRVINVIGAEQTLAQLQLKVALCALGHSDLALRQQHFAYGLLEFPGFRMSSRRGRIITLDEVIDESIRRAYEEVSKRSPSLSEAEKRGMAETIGVQAIKYALLSIEPVRTITFSWDRVLDFERNSAPFINYAYTRTSGILRKIGELPSEVDGSLLSNPLEKMLILEVARFPEVFVEAADKLKPDDLAVYANNLAEKFHEYYEKVDVSHVEDPMLKNARATLVKALQTVLRNAMWVLGIRLAERM